MSLPSLSSISRHTFKMPFELCCMIVKPSLVLSLSQVDPAAPQVRVTHADLHTNAHKLLNIRTIAADIVFFTAQ